MENIDRELYNSATTLKYILPENFHDRAFGEQGISIDEDKYIANKLTKLVKETHLKYNYTIGKKGNKLFFVTSDITADPETKRGTFYLYPYEEADESFISAFGKEKPTFKTVSDQWGIVRTVMVPEKTPGGLTYLACADYDISYVYKNLRRNLLQSIGTILFFLLLAMPILFIYRKLRLKYLVSLKESEEKYRTLFEKANDAVFVVEKKTGRYLDVNESGLRLTGRNRAELLQLTTQDVTPEGAKSRLQKINEFKEIQEFGETIYIRPGGERRIATLNVIPLDNEKFIGIARDITNEIVLNERLRQSQKMEAIGKLSGGIAHDFNNILSGIFGYTQLAQSNIGNSKKAKKYLDQVVKAAKRAAELVQQILTFSRQTEYKKHPYRLYSGVNEVLKLLRSSLPSTIEIVKKLSSKSTVLADPIKVHQIVMNLCTNANHAMNRASGRLTVSLTDVEILESKYLWDKKIPIGNYVVLEVSDNGKGMDKKELEKAFDPYFTTKELGQGTGLGLALVHAIVDEHDGFLDVYSEPGKGTRFYVYFPIIGLEPEEKDFTDQKQIKMKGNETILLVDDEQAIRHSCSQFLKSQGYKVVLFSNGMDALNGFKTEPNRFDLIITDQTMPGLTGDEFAKEVLKIKPEIPIILCTGFNENMTDARRKDLGIKKLVQKPIQIQQLTILARKILDKINP